MSNLHSLKRSHLPISASNGSSFSIHQPRIPIATFILSLLHHNYLNNRQSTVEPSPRSWLTMLTPTIGVKTAFFYAFGNTPATSLTRCVPQGQDVDILSLGCGDLRNILYTTYIEKGFRMFSFHRFLTLWLTEAAQRQIDFTCCDVADTIIGRPSTLYQSASRLLTVHSSQCLLSSFTPWWGVQTE